MMKNVIVGIGELLWDMLPGGKVLGGAPANFAYHVTQFGFQGCAISAIGNDALGEEITQSLTEKSLRHEIQITEHPTGTVDVLLNDDGIPQYEICENVAWDNIACTPALEDIARVTQTVCFGSLAQRNVISRNTIKKFISMLPEGAWKVFDINLRQSFYSQEIIEDSMSICDVLKINDDEIEILIDLLNLKADDEIEACRQLIEKYQLKILVLTKGTEGSYVVTPENVSFRPTPKVKAIDTVGAGDSFTAAFIAALLKGKSIEVAHEVAVEISAYVCTQNGAMPVLPDNLISKVNE